MKSTGLTIEVTRFELLVALYDYILEHKDALSDEEGAVIAKTHIADVDLTLPESISIMLETGRNDHGVPRRRQAEHVKSKPDSDAKSGGIL